MILTARSCKEQIEKINPDLVVKSVKDYGNSFLITYLYKNNENTPDPFLLVNKRDGKVSNYTIAEDLNKYYSTPDIFIN